MDLIAKGLKEGFMHPGPEGGEPTRVMLPGLRTTGMAPEMAELIDGTVNLIAEGVVAIIEGEGQSEIVDKERVASLRIAEDSAPLRTVTVFDQGDRQRSVPLFVLTIINGSHATVDTKRLFRALQKREGSATEVPTESAPEDPTEGQS